MSRLVVILLGAIVLLIAGIGVAGWLLLTGRPVVLPADTPTPATLPTAEAPTAPPAATAVVTNTLAIGANAVVTGTGQCLNVRQNPTLSGSAVDCLPDGTQLRILAGPVPADNVTWWQVTRLSVPSEGWVSGQYLQPLPP